MQEIMGKLNMTDNQKNKMRGVYPKLGKVRDSLNAKNLSPEKIRKEMQLYIENALLELLSGATVAALRDFFDLFSMPPPISLARRSARIRGVFPSSNVTTGVASLTGRWSA